MDYGLQLSASGVLTSLYRQDVHTNNLANLGTKGFKPDVPLARQRDAARIEDELGLMPSNAMLERLGAGVLMAPNRISFDQGPLEVTGNPLDLGIMGDGFFMVRDERAEGEEGVRLTRDGRLDLDARGRLVMSSTGMPVLDDRGRAIRLEPGSQLDVTIDGTVSVDGEEVGRLAIVDVPDRSRLRKLGSGLFEAPESALENRTRATGRVRQGTVEGAAINEISAMMQVQSASRAVGSNIGMITYHDRLMERAINTFARLA